MTKTSIRVAAAQICVLLPPPEHACIHTDLPRDYIFLITALAAACHNRQTHCDECTYTVSGIVPDVCRPSDLRSLFVATQLMASNRAVPVIAPDISPSRDSFADIIAFPICITTGTASDDSWSNRNICHEKKKTTLINYYLSYSFGIRKIRKIHYKMLYNWFMF